MIEFPEATTLSRQINDTLVGKEIVFAEGGHSFHSFAWYFGDPSAYGNTLVGKKILSSQAVGGHVRVLLDGATMLFTDGANMRYLPYGAKRPQKHQLLVEFDDGTGLAVSVQMYGGIIAFSNVLYENPYYQSALRCPSPLSSDFDYNYFLSLRDKQSESLSAKAYLATNQRIPGLGNGILQDILYNAKIHPKQKMKNLSEQDYHNLYLTLRSVLTDMTEKGGRNVEKDLFGNFGKYETLCSKNTVGNYCPRCGGIITKEPYLGGAIYYCTGCQKL